MIGLEYMVYVWLGLAVFLAVLEVATAQLVSVWFVAGALVSLVCAATFFSDNILLQVIVFIVVSAIALIITRPLMKKLKKFDKTHTNSDRYLGKVGVVTQDIDNVRATGMVEIDGSKWTARSSSDEVIASGEKVIVDEIKGVKLMVSKNIK